jgi:hypothetical protein
MDEKRSLVYLKEKQLYFDHVVNGDFSSLGIRATPAILLLDRNGKVLMQWHGFVSSQEESQVQTELRDSMNAATFAMPTKTSENLRANLPFDVVEGATVKAMQRIGAPILVLDVRERSDFARNHWLGSVNIPVSELEIRARHEIMTNSEVFIHYRDKEMQCKVSDKQGEQRKPILNLGQVAGKILASTGVARRIAIVEGEPP